MYYTILKYRRN